MIRALILDLDDTLYCETDFVASGYRAVAKELSVVCGRSHQEIYQTMMSTLERQGRRSVMPGVLECYPACGLHVADLVGIYRRHTPEIKLFPGYAELLKILRCAYRLGIVTDGDPAVQRSKCAALGLDSFVDNIICTWEYGPEKEKPHPYSFCLMLACLQSEPEETLVIGDSVEKDCLGARAAGLKCVRVQKPQLKCGLSHVEKADFVIESLFQLPLVLRQLEGRNEAA